MAAFFLAVLVIALFYMGLQSVVAVVALAGTAWRALEALIVGGWRGLVLSWHLTRWTGRQAVRCVRFIVRGALAAHWLDTWLGRHAHVWGFGAAYRLRRNYIAGQLRAMRRARRET